MKRKDSLSPYPILDGRTNDYINSIFLAEIEVVHEFQELYIRVSFILENEEIQQCIDNHEMSFALHVESPSTGYRKIINTHEDALIEKIVLNDVGNKIEINPFIIATKEIREFKNKCFHADYLNYSFDISAANIIACAEGKEITLDKDDNILDNIPSIIKVLRRHDKLNGTITVDTDNSDYIGIGLQDVYYDMYYALGRKKFKYAALSFVLLPAMIVVLTRMIDAEEDEKEKNWYQVISRILEKNGIMVDDLSVDNKKNSVLAVAQKLFSNPIGQGFDELERINPRG